MAVGSIAGAWGYLNWDGKQQQTSETIQPLARQYQRHSPAQLLQLSHQSVFDALILDIVYQLGWRAQYWITKLNDLQYFSHN